MECNELYTNHYVGNLYDEQNKPKFFKYNKWLWLFFYFISLFLCLEYSTHKVTVLMTLVAELFLYILILCTVILWLLQLRWNNRRRWIEKKMTYNKAITFIIKYSLLPVFLLIYSNNIYWTYNSYLKSSWKYISELENNVVIGDFYKQNKSEIVNEICNIANEKAGYPVLWAWENETTQAPKEKLWDEFWDEVFKELNTVLLEKIKKWERQN